LFLERRSKTVKKKKTSAEKAMEPLKGETNHEAAGLPSRSLSLGIKKEYLKSKKTCKVTFRLPRIAAPKARDVCIVGDFNGWNIYANPMKRLKTGDYTITLELELGREYQFRYLIDGSKWENDWNADKYVRSPFGDSDNSVIVV